MSPLNCLLSTSDKTLPSFLFSKDDVEKKIKNSGIFISHVVPSHNFLGPFLLS